MFSCILSEFNNFFYFLFWQHDEKQLPANDLIKDLGCKKDVDSNIGQLLEDSDADDDLVAVEIRPGYVLFTSAGKGSAALILGLNNCLCISIYIILL